MRDSRSRRSEWSRQQVSLMVRVPVPVCQPATTAAMMIRSQAGALVWKSWAISSCYSTCGQKHSVQFALSAPSGSSGCWKKYVSLVIQRKARLYFDVAVFNRGPRRPWLRVPVARTSHKNFETVSCNAPVIRDVHGWGGVTRRHLLRWHLVTLLSKNGHDLTTEHWFNDYMPGIGWHDCPNSLNW